MPNAMKAMKKVKAKKAAAAPTPKDMPPSPLTVSHPIHPHILCRWCGLLLLCLAGRVARATRPGPPSKANSTTHPYILCRWCGLLLFCLAGRVATHKGQARPLGPEARAGKARPQRARSHRAPGCLQPGHEGFIFDCFFYVFVFVVETLFFIFIFICKDNTQNMFNGRWSWRAAVTA